MAMKIVNISDAPYRHPSLKGDMFFRLWKAATKDDDALADELIRAMYDALLAFDRERAEDVMGLIVRRAPTARDSFKALLQDIQTFRS
jgi:hypothetical protein